MRSAVDITGDDIDTWSRKTSALAELPVLVRRLLLATADPDQIDFPGDGGTRLGGWDGIATANRSSTYCPAGSSGWEVTVEKRKGKFDEDFKKRVWGAQVAGQPGVSTYVAVTARRYGKKREWVQEKIKSGPWADVRLWDADDLATWLGIAPAVYAWFSRKIGHPLGELLGPDEFRSRWSNRTRPPLPSRLVLAGKVRRDSAEQLRKCLRTGPGAVICVQADTREEAALFVAEALCEKGVEEASARVLLVESSDAWNWAATAQAPRPQVLVPTFAGFDLGSAAGINAAVVVPFGPEAAVSGHDCIQIQRLRFEPVVQVLVEEGVDESAARQLVTRSGAKLGAMQRLCGYVVSPAWSSNASLPEATTLLLLGAFCPGNESDVAVVRGLGVDPSKLESLCQALLVAPGRPVESVQDGFGPRCWRWTSPGEAWEVLAPKIGRAQFEAFSRAVLEVLGADDPCYSLPLEKRAYASILRKVLPHSDELRVGLARSVTWLSLADPALTSALGPGAGSMAAQGLVRQLLGADWLRWASLSDLLPILAEAAPDAFLEALEASLAVGNTGVCRLFQEEGSGLFHGPSPHTGLLWALESLAWSKPHASRAAGALARLAANDPPEEPGQPRLANRPNRSLAAVLSPGIPQSATSADDRIGIMASLVQREPDVAWKVMLDSLDGGSFHSSTHRPQIVGWDLPPILARATFPEYATQVHGWVGLMLPMCDGRPDRLAKMAAVSRKVPADLQVKILECIERVVTIKDSADPHGEVWTALRRERWLLAHVGDDEGTRDYAARVSSLYDRLTPSDVALAVAWLFAQELLLVPGEEMDDIPRASMRAAGLRAEAIDLIRRQPERLRILHRLCDLGVHPFILGDALARSEWATELVAKIEFSKDEVPAALVPSFLVAYVPKAGHDWLVSRLQALAAEGGRDLVLAALRLMPSDATTWKILEKLGAEYHGEYWKTIPHPYGSRTPEEDHHAIAALLEVGRPGAALALAGHMDKTLAEQTALTVLEAVRAAGDAEAVLREVGANMFGYYLGKVFERADASGEEERLCQLEVFFFRALEHGDRRPRMVFNALAADPGLFAQMVASIYRSDGVDDADEGSEPTPRAVQIAHTCDDILRAWHGYPGDMAADSVERERLLGAWAQRVVDRTAALGRAVVGLIRLAEVLARAAPGDDGVWPANTVRELLEPGLHPELAQHIVIAELNARGITCRGHLDGGKQERDLATRYRGWANQLRTQWPRTAAMVDDIAKSYERQGQREDLAVQSDRVRFGD